MSNVIVLEGMPRGFLSTYTTILLTFRELIGRRGIDPSKVKIAPVMFSRYGHPSNWFNKDYIASNLNGKHYGSTEFVDIDPWPTTEQLNLLWYTQFLPYSDRINNYLNKNLLELDNCLGIHYRGTDHVWHTDRVTLDIFFESLGKEFESKQYDQVFICTDEQNVIEQFQKFLKDRYNFTNVVYNNTIKSPTKTSLHYTNFDPVTKIKLGDQVLLDSHSISKCKSVICKTSNIINYARILNLNLTPIYQDKDSDFRG